MIRLIHTCRISLSIRSKKHMKYWVKGGDMYLYTNKEQEVGQEKIKGYESRNATNASDPPAPIYNVAVSIIAIYTPGRSHRGKDDGDTPLSPLTRRIDTAIWRHWPTTQPPTRAIYDTIVYWGTRGSPANQK